MVILTYLLMLLDSYLSFYLTILFIYLINGLAIDNIILIAGKIAIEFFKIIFIKQIDQLSKILDR